MGRDTQVVLFVFAVCLCCRFLRPASGMGPRSWSSPDLAIHAQTGTRGSGTSTPARSSAARTPGSLPWHEHDGHFQRRLRHWRSVGGSWSEPRNCACGRARTHTLYRCVRDVRTLCMSCTLLRMRDMRAGHVPFRLQPADGRVHPLLLVRVCTACVQVRVTFRPPDARLRCAIGRRSRCSVGSRGVRPGRAPSWRRGSCGP